MEGVADLTAIKVVCAPDEHQRHAWATHDEVKDFTHSERSLSLRSQRLGIGKIGYCCGAEGGICNRSPILSVDARPAHYLVIVIVINRWNLIALVSPVTR